MIQESQVNSVAVDTYESGIQIQLDPIYLALQYSEKMKLDLTQSLVLLHIDLSTHFQLE